MELKSWYCGIIGLFTILGYLIAGEVGAAISTVIAGIFLILGIIFKCRWASE